jgi:hypothetical protein
VEGEGLALCYCRQVGIAIITSMRAVTPTTSKRGISGYMQVRILDGVIHRIGILKAVIHSNRLFRQGFRWGFRRHCPAVLSSRTGHGSDATLGPVPWWEWGAPSGQIISVGGVRRRSCSRGACFPLQPHHAGAFKHPVLPSTSCQSSSANPISLSLFCYRPQHHAGRWEQYYPNV